MCIGITNPIVCSTCTSSSSCSPTPSPMSSRLIRLIVALLGSRMLLFGTELQCDMRMSDNLMLSLICHSVYIIPRLSHDRQLMYLCNNISLKITEIRIAYINMYYMKCIACIKNWKQHTIYPCSA
ncbi:hypothetical protein Dimus_039707 [Dionaea muscipula]